MELITERLILREFRQEDWAEVLTYQSDPLYLRYYEWTERTPESVQEFVGMFLAHQQEQPRFKFQLAVTLKSTQQLIGNCGIRMKSPGAIEGDIGYELSPAHWGRGYATEAGRAILAFGFTRLGLHRVSSWCVADNTASAHVLQKLGMQPEGRLRENEYYKGRYWDTLVFGILDYEWKSRQD